MADTKIEWAEKTWSPITGCTPISEGCAHCYAQRMANRFKGRYGYPADVPFRVTFHPERLKEPLKWRKPRRIFVCSMGDLFHISVPVKWIDSVFSKICECRGNHIFIILTKRPERMAEWFQYAQKEHSGWFNPFTGKLDLWQCWIGVTAENQQRADERIPILLQIPAAKRFVSLEPLLGPVDLTNMQRVLWEYDDEYGTPMRRKAHPGLDWVIVGGETGPGARPMQSDWARLVRDQCESEGVPFFFKKHGDWWCKEFGKKPGWRENRELDGREWNEFPE